MSKPALYLALALAATLLAVSAATSILSLAQTRRVRAELIALGRGQASLHERLRELSVALQLAAAERAPAAALPRPAFAPSASTAPALSPATVAGAPDSPPTSPSLEPAGEPFPQALVSPAPFPQAPVPQAPFPQATAAQAPTSDPEADLAVLQEMAGGLRCFEQARYAEAFTCFAAVLERQPANTQARYCYAASLYRANPGASDRYAEIERHLEQVLREQPENASALELSGRVRAERECWSDALDFFQRALELRPADPDCLRMAGHSALYGGDPEAAERYLLRACSLSGKAAEPWHLLALARERSGKPEQALAGYLRCLELDPGFPQARLRAGLLLLELGRSREARELLQEHARRRPGAEGWTALGDCLYALGESQPAEELWQRALRELSPVVPRERRAAAELYLRLSRAAWQRRSGEQSLALAEQGLRCEPLPLLRAYQGLGCLAAGQPVRGKALLLALVEEHPGSQAAVLAAEALAEESPERSPP
jgi:tetratricopeptide (TPR) repeat protein